MKELNDILDAIDRVSAGQSSVLVTLVELSGSAYRQPGARMLILPDGESVGTITGGCLEAEIRRRAGERGEFPRVSVYSTESEDDAVIGFGMGCKGRLHLLFERIEGGNEPGWLGRFRERLSSGKIQALATVFDSSGQNAPPIGAKLIVDDETVDAIGAWTDQAREAAAEQCRIAMRSGRSLARSIQLPQAEFHAFIEVFHPPVRLLIFGANDAARPLARLAKTLGWSVAICDRRPAYGDRAKLPEADEVICAAAGELREHIRVDAGTAGVIMTHNYAEDRALLGMMLDSAAFYVGLLGARARTQQLLAELRCEREISEQQFKRLHSPIGLDIGADNSEEIALAIVSEIQAVRRGRSGGALRERERPIHHPT